MTRRERLERKLEKREEWAGKAATRSAQRFDTAHTLGDQLTPGQPILVGHHSEKRHRNHIKKIDTNMRKAFEEKDKASHHASKADGLRVALDTSIYSDDDNAIEELEKRIKANEDTRALMRETNRLYRKGDAEALAKRGYDLEKLRAEIAERYSWEQKGPYRPYELSNLGGRITADKKRLVAVKAQQERSTAADQQEDGVFIETSEKWHGYCRITFAEKPDRSVLNALKAAGFTWGAGSWSGKADQIPEEVTA